MLVGMIGTIDHQLKYLQGRNVYDEFVETTI